MSSRQRSSFFSSPTSAAPVVITIDGIAAGFALRDTWRFRFFSGHPRFDLLDGSRFSRIEDVRWAVKRLAQASAEPAGGKTALREREPVDECAA
jgi:hypothetical protein